MPLALLLTASLGAQERVVVLTNVSVIPLDRERVLEDQMHAHVPMSQAEQQLGAGEAERVVFLFLANGVTTIRGMQGHPAYFGTTDIGTVERGKVADLVLLDGNPLADITNTTRISGVMARGVWVSRADIDRRLAGIAAGH